MRGLLLFMLWLTILMQPQSFTCTTAPAHAHDQIREGQIQITSWTGCALSGTVNGVNVQLWADSSTCGLRSKVPGVFQVRYDDTCKQVLDLSDGPLPPYCPPSPSPTPTPTPAASPTPAPSPSPSPITPESCTITAPASVVVPANGFGQVSVSLTSTPTRSITVTAVSNSGQVFVSPTSQTVLAGSTSAVVAFGLKAKKRGAIVTFSSPGCVSRSTTVVVR